jgi:beta-glucosidase
MLPPLPYRNPELPLEVRVNDLLSRMTLPEKIGQMMQLNGHIDPVETIEKYQPGSLLHILNEPLSAAMDAAERTRLGIPLLIGEDGIHGHSFHAGATIFPTQLGLAASWDIELLEQVARVTAREMAPTGAHWTFSPVLCLTRDQRWGRTGETFGEDPYVIAELGAAMIRGYQGSGLNDPTAVLACAKHYAGYSETQGGRDASEADISRRKLRSFFLPPFERAARQGCMTFMTGYQSMDGLPSTANHWLLRQVLKEEWGFKGILVTDWDNVARLHYEQRIAPSMVEAAVIAVRCGNDLIMATPSFFEAAQEAVARGLLQESEIDEIVQRILALKFAMGLFENPRRPSAAAAESIIGCEAHRAVALRAARESIVLLKNDGLLPLAEGRYGSIAVLGPNADDCLSQLGDWSLGSSQYPSRFGQQPRECTVTILDGIRARAKNCEVVDNPEQAELTIVVVGDSLPYIGETRSTATLELQNGQAELIESIAATRRPFVLVLVASKPQVLPPAALSANAIIECFNPGMLGGTALAEILFGDQNPSGKLTISYPRHVGQQPIFYSQIRGQHGDTYADLTQEPLFPFGHGLSYTTFEYRNLRVLTPLVKRGQSVELDLQVANVGDRDGVEIVQVYLSDLVTSVTWVDRSLVAFARVPLRSGESTTVHISIAYEQLSLVNAFEQRVVEPGEFELTIGGSSAPTQKLEGRFVVEGEAFSYSWIPGVARR